MPVCDNCDSFVTHDFARVFGDNAERVAGCLKCMSIGEFVNHDRHESTAGDIMDATYS